MDVVDETLVVASREQLAQKFADPSLWRAWWPDLVLQVTLERGADGIVWSVSGSLAGTAEIWLEPWHDGVIVHWYLRAELREPVDRDHVRRRYATAFKRHITALKDELESGRPAGFPRIPDR
jgi:hypothetical protein